MPSSSPTLFPALLLLLLLTIVSLTNAYAVIKAEYDSTDCTGPQLKQSASNCNSVCESFPEASLSIQCVMDYNNGNFTIFNHVDVECPGDFVIPHGPTGCGSCSPNPKDETESVRSVCSSQDLRNDFVVSDRHGTVLVHTYEADDTLCEGEPMVTEDFICDDECYESYSHSSYYRCFFRELAGLPEDPLPYVIDLYPNFGCTDSPTGRQTSPCNGCDQARTCQIAIDELPPATPPPAPTPNPTSSSPTPPSPTTATPTPTPAPTPTTPTTPTSSTPSTSHTTSSPTPTSPPPTTPTSSSPSPSPTTAAPTSSSPSPSPTTAAPTTASPTTAAPTTAAPTTATPTTAAPTTAAPTTAPTISTPTPTSPTPTSTSPTPSSPTPTSSPIGSIASVNASANTLILFALFFCLSLVAV